MVSGRVVGITYCELGHNNLKHRSFVLLYFLALSFNLNIARPNDFHALLMNSTLFRSPGDVAHSASTVAADVVPTSVRALFFSAASCAFVCTCPPMAVSVCPGIHHSSSHPF